MVKKNQPTRVQKNNLSFWLIICFIAISLISSTHKYYHSHCTLELNKKTGSAEAVMEIFWHDLEASVSNFSGRKLKFTDSDFQQQLKQYLTVHFVIRDSSKSLIPFQLIGCELKSDEVSVYIEFPSIKNFKGLELENSLLVQEFPEQVNQVNIKNESGKKSMVFTSKNTKQILN